MKSFARLLILAAGIGGGFAGGMAYQGHLHEQERQAEEAEKKKVEAEAAKKRKPPKPVKGLPGHYSYKDDKGVTHITDDFNKVPEKYRK